MALTAQQQKQQHRKLVKQQRRTYHRLRADYERRMVSERAHSALDRELDARIAAER